MNTETPDIRTSDEVQTDQRVRDALRHLHATDPQAPDAATMLDRAREATRASAPANDDAERAGSRGAARAAMLALAAALLLASAWLLSRPATTPAPDPSRDAAHLATRDHAPTRRTTGAPPREVATTTHGAHTNQTTNQTTNQATTRATPAPGTLASLRFADLSDWEPPTDFLLDAPFDNPLPDRVALPDDLDDLPELIPANETMEL